MDQQNPDLEVFKISEDLSNFIMGMLLQVSEIVRKRNEELKTNNDVADICAVSLALLSMIYGNCPDDKKANFKEAMRWNIDAL